VTIPTASLAPPTSPQQNILATVSVSNVTGGGGGTPPPPLPNTSPPGTNTPEPSSIILACSAIAFLGTAGVRRSRLHLTVV
jgi:hypothetical protein